MSAEAGQSEREERFVKTPEEELIEVYIEAFNRHDVEAVIACFHDAAVLVDTQGRQVEGLDAVRRRYEEDFAFIPDGRCDLRTATGHDGRGVAETLFHGTVRDGGPVKAIGTEVMEFTDGKISAIRDYHQLAI
jgi:ketosteroid isomerase-like protein